MFASTLFRLVLVVGMLAPPVVSAQSGRAVDAIGMIGSQGYDAAYRAIAPDDEATRDVITWMRLADTGQPFADYAPFLERRSDWPRLNRIYAAGERAMPSGLPPRDVVAWFDGRTPETGEGAVKLDRAMTALGEGEAAEAMLIDLWRNAALSASSHAAMLAAHPDLLAPHHLARADAMLWRWRTTDAARQLPLLEEGPAALVRARIALIGDSGGIDAAIAAVPEEYADDPGLAYDRYNWRADNRQREGAIELLRARSTSAEALGEPFRWAGWRRTLARWEMRNGDPAVAYEMAANHFLTPEDGSAFTDLEWLAGYLALTYLDDAETALSHFDTGFAAARTPITISRMGYWQGRAHEALGDAASARAAYTAAAPFQTAFYGLLAAEKIGAGLDPALTGRDDADDWGHSDVLADDAVRAALTLMAAGRRSDAIPFFVNAAKRLSEDDLARLGAYLNAHDRTYYEVLIGKTATNEGKIVPSIYFPIHEMVEMDLPVDQALAHAIARRESEFWPQAGSPVGAQGLMQLMPGTAREVAGWEGLPYSQPRLTSDWEYNARLGARYLAELELQFGRSPVMVAAGYNAGPSRPLTWMDERGDPRVGEVDIVDWIEHIPFRETRNYVMRVTESLPVYRARLRGELGPVAFTQLLIGEKPRIRPSSRPDRRAVVSTSEVSTTTPFAEDTSAVPDLPPSNVDLPRANERPVGPSAAAPVRSLRPVARAGG